MTLWGRNLYLVSFLLFLMFLKMLSSSVKSKTAIDDSASSLKRFGLTNCNKLDNKCIILVSVQI